MCIQKRFIFVIILQIVVLYPLLGEFAGGTGTAEDPWQITTHEHLDNVRNYLGPAHHDKHFVLMNNIDLGEEFEPGGTYYNNGEGWQPIGNYYLRFNGNFDGNNNAITGLFLERSANYQGLFGFTHDAVINSLSLEEVEINGDYCAGALIGYADSTIVNSCYSTGLVRGSNQVGGLIGRTMSFSEITDSNSSCNVEADESAGGLVGYLSTSVMIDCHSTGRVDGDVRVGGLLGRVNRSTVKTSNSTGNVNGNSKIGGLIGDTAMSEIINNHSTSNVSGYSGIGGLIGYSYESSISDNSINSNIIGIYSVGGLIGLLKSSNTEKNVSSGNVSGMDYVGGLVGSTLLSTINECHSNSNVSGNQVVGGLTGRVSRSVVTNCFNKGNVGGFHKVGGFIGIIHQESLIINSYNRGNVTRVGGTSNILGGFCGSYDQAKGISNCYSTGYVKTETGENIEGKGFCGLHHGNISNNYFDMDTSEQTYSYGAEGRTTEEMTYPYADNTYVGWDFDDIWAMDENYEINDGYPYLQGIDYVSAEDEPFIISPSEITLFNYPNPFNPETTIDFSLTQSGLVTIEIYNIRGQKVRTLINSEYAAGQHSVVWDGRDDRGREAAGGVYLYRLHSGEHIETRKMLLLK